MALSVSNISVGGRELGIDVDGWAREITAQVPLQLLRKNPGQRTCLSRCAISN